MSRLYRARQQVVRRPRAAQPVAVSTDPDEDFSPEEA